MGQLGKRGAWVERRKAVRAENTFLVLNCYRRNNGVNRVRGPRAALRQGAPTQFSQLPPNRLSNL